MTDGRRKVLGVVAAVPAAAALGASAFASDENLVRLINRYRAAIAAANASHDLTDEELDAWIDRADEILVEVEAVELSV